MKQSLTLTWDYIVEQMKEKYGIRIESDEQFNLFEIEACIEKIFNDYYKENQIKNEKEN